MRPDTHARLVQAAPGCFFDQEGPDWETSGACETHQGKVRLLDELATLDSEHPDVREIAARFRSAWPLPSDLARKLHAYAQRIRFVDDGPETFTSTLRTIARGFGDCDDSTRVLVALARAAGLRARLVTLDTDGIPTHVAAQLHDGAGWSWAETSVAARFGESPLDAKARLGLGGRTDIAAIGALGDVGGSYEDQALAMVQQAGADSQFMAEAAPLVRVGVQIYDLASTAAQGEAPAEAIAAVALDMALQVAAQVSTSVSGMSQLLPVVGAIVGAIFAPPATADPGQAKANCEARDQHRGYPLASGVGGEIRPVDYFRRPCPASDGSEGSVTFRAEAIANGACEPRIGEVFWSLMRAPGGSPELLAQVRQKFGEPNLGISYATKARLRALMDGISAGYLRADGGGTLWPILMDTIRIAFARGELSTKYMRYLVVKSDALGDSAERASGQTYPLTQADLLNSHLVGLSAGSGGAWAANNTACINFWGPSAVDAFANMVFAWQNTVFPAYDDDRTAQAEAEAVAYARDRLGGGLGFRSGVLRTSLQRVIKRKGDLPPATLEKLRGKLSTLPRPPLSAPAKVAGVGALAAAAWWAYRWL